MTAQVGEFLSMKWETQLESLAPGFRLGNYRTPMKKQVDRFALSFSLSSFSFHLLPSLSFLFYLLVNSIKQQTFLKDKLICVQTMV